MIEDKAGMAPVNQRLFYNGIELENGHTLSDYNVQDGAEINMLYRGLGGGT